MAVQQEESLKQIDEKEETLAKFKDLLAGLRLQEKEDAKSETVKSTMEEWVAVAKKATACADVKDNQYAINIPWIAIVAMQIASKMAAVEQQQAKGESVAKDEQAPVAATPPELLQQAAAKDEMLARKDAAVAYFKKQVLKPGICGSTPKRWLQTRPKCSRSISPKRGTTFWPSIRPSVPLR